MRFLIVAAALLTACATSSPTYGPAASSNGPGYSEMQIESDRYVVTYRAAGAADGGLLQDYALLRAAELTMENNRDWFWVDRRDVDDSGGRGGYGGPSIGIGVGGGSWGGRSGASVGVGVNIPVGSRGGATARVARLEIRFGCGVKPDDVNAYDARAISANLRSRLMAR